MAVLPPPEAEVAVWRRFRGDLGEGSLKGNCLVNGTDKVGRWRGHLELRERIIEELLDLGIEGRIQFKNTSCVIM